MSKYDKDRLQKELAIRYCLVRGMVPFLEVIIPSASSLSNSNEVLTDLDVVGIEADNDGVQRYVFFDCKSSAKMSAINRAFWAAGVKSYVNFDQAYVILKSRPLTNHRLSALVCNIDLHDETSFKNLGRRVDEGFPSDCRYQSSISRWWVVVEKYNKNGWSKDLFGLVRSEVPLSRTPWTTFRHIIAEMLRTKGNFDPGKAEHIAIFLDVLASAMVLWGSLAKDISRFFESQMDRVSFERVLRYYIWGGKEGYQTRKQLVKLAKMGTTDVPAWTRLVDYAGLTVSAPRCLLSCAHVYRELSIRAVAGANPEFDAALARTISADNRIRQFMLGMSGYLVEGCELPKDLGEKVEGLLLNELG